MPKLLIATQNKGKCLEIKALLSDLNFELITPEQLNLNLDVIEDGETYLENAQKKAKAYASASGFLSLADDSGLEVAVLGGMPGIFSARFSRKPGATDADRRAFLLHKLQSHPRPWKAEFKCMVYIQIPGGRAFQATGVCQGEIIPEERGSYGFGYDPIFKVNGTHLTMAELSFEVKNQLSHRALAIRSLKPFLDKYLSGVLGKSIEKP